MGNAFLTPEATTVIGWGSGIPGITEINQQGDVLYELHFEGLNYRAYRFPWETNYFKTNADTLDFGFIWSGSKKTDTIEIRNMQEEEILITGHHLHSDIFSVENEYPVVIPAGDTGFLLVTFNPEEEGVYGDLLTIQSDTNSDTLVQRIARQVKLTGHATEGQGTGSFQSLQVTASPNPVSGMLTLSFGERMEAATVSVVNARGQTVMERSFGESASYTLDMHSLPEGLYLIEIRSGKAWKQGAVKIVKSRD